MGIPGSSVSQSLWITTLLPSILAALITALLVSAGSIWFTNRNQKHRDEDAWNHNIEKIQAQFQNDLEKIKAQFQDDREKLRLEVKEELEIEREKGMRELLDELWKGLVKVYSSVRNITIPWRDYPDLNSWDIGQLDEFIKTLKFSDYDKDQLRNAEDKTKFYSSIKEKYDLMDVIINYGGFHNLLIDKSPHIPDDLKGKLIEIDQCILLFSSRMQMQLYYDALYPIHSRNKIYSEFHEEADTIYAEIEKLVQQRLNRDIRQTAESV
jgi:hypothetical protein